MCAFVQDLRWLDLYRSPGVGETLDWVQAFHALGHHQMDPDVVSSTLGTLLKERDDLERIRAGDLPAAVARSEARAHELRQNNYQ